MAVRLADGRVARYPSLNGEGIALTPHQERPDVTWAALADEFGPEVARVLTLQAQAAEEAHVASGCALTDAVAERLTAALEGSEG